MKFYEVVFKEKGKKYYFTFEDDIVLGTNVIVNTEKGFQLAKVVGVVDKKLQLPVNDIKAIIRTASHDDYEKYLENLKEANEALKKAKRIVQELNLKMNIINASYTFDKKQLLFNFISDERVDFRELARRLASVYKTRIELRQIGARDKAKEISGVGPCGQELCCSRFLNKMETVSMNMAKNQNVSLNPQKINGVCGRLLCCLTYEDEEYKRCLKNLPNIGQVIKTRFGEGPVTNINILERKVTVLIENEKKEINYNEIKV